MAEGTSTAAAAPAKAPKKKAAAQPKKAGPSVGESGVALAALKKSLAAGGYDVEKNNSRVKIAVKSLVTKGTLVQTKGTGASGSFKLNKKAVEAKKNRQESRAAKKPRRSPLHPKRPQEPKEVKKPAAAAKKAAKSPKKATKAVKPKGAKPRHAAPHSQHWCDMCRIRMSH
uniref:H15 domain-containing protein n=1 Tax=Oncorhynchus kisutch TaxID=8019 RepID=A0A8C7H8X3_ONCKI